MEPAEASDRGIDLSDLPSIDVLLKTETAIRLESVIGKTRSTALARDAVASIRAELLDPSSGAKGLEPALLLIEAERRMKAAYAAGEQTATRRVINATGVVIHTNLGRAPLSQNARRAVADAASGYCTVEYDLTTGKRGRRGKHAEELICELTDADAALIVNNCAAAAFLVLKVFASGGEVVISRGELVEIGGDFRVPDVLEQSGAVLREVGTTNRTKLADYENAIGESTRMILRVHPSNYKIIGFTATPSLAELANAAHRRSVLFYEDIGSGALIDLSSYGLGDEPVVGSSIRDGVDIVTFSGDKLLGGPQSGIIAGRRELIERIRKHPLYRALRVGKMVYAALEATLGAYRRGTAVSEVPVLNMISTDREALTARAETFAVQVNRSNVLSAKTLNGSSVIGGGAAPAVHPETTLVSLAHKDLSARLVGEKLRTSSPPVIARIEDDQVLIDLRTVSDADEVELLQILSRFSVQNPA